MDSAYCSEHVWFSYIKLRKTTLVALTRQKLSEPALVKVCVVLKVLVLHNIVMNISCKFVVSLVLLETKET